MAKKKNIKSIVKRFVALLSQDIYVQKVFLFGSYAKGHPNKNSDIDIAVVSPKFGKRNEMEEMTYLLKKAHEIDIDLEPHPYHPSELKNPSKSSFVAEILRTGKVIYEETKAA